MHESNGLSILSFGFTRELWNEESTDENQRLMAYARHLKQYVVVANSYKRHGLAPRSVAENFEAIPTDAFSPLDSLVRMVRIGTRLLRARRFDLIQAQDPIFCGAVAVWLSRQFGVPVNVCVYGPNVYDPNWRRAQPLNRVLAPLGRIVLNAAHGIQVDGQMTSRALIAAGVEPSRVRVKPMVPINLDRFLAIPREMRPTGKPRLLFVGRLVRQKNLPLLLEALKSINDSDWELRIVGEGPERAGLEARVRSDGLSSRVSFTGTISRDQIPQVFAEADVFVLSSYYEGYPRVLMEAAAAALPIVTTAVSGSDEAVADGESGYVVPVGSAEALAEKLAVLFIDAERRRTMGLAGRSRVRAKLDPGSNTTAQLAIWRSITGRSTELPATDTLINF